MLGGRGSQVIVVAIVSLWAVAPNLRADSLETELEAFFQPGSQPSGEVVYEAFRPSSNCQNCHFGLGDEVFVIYANWQGSMMAQSGRDPMFHACLAIANQDADFAGDVCLRCHTAGGWIQGRSEPTDGSALVPDDFDGVSCSVCHRMVDPQFKPGVSPAIDEQILAEINPLPISPGGGNFVLDSADRRRGPYDNIFNAGHSWLQSPYHRTSEMCATCHDVSNPLYLRQPDGTYALTDPTQPHPTADKYDMFPLERTYSEWLNSEYANGGVDAGGRFGGNIEVVSTCQDCHMPKTTGMGCFVPGTPVRDDLAAHDFAGGNAWAQDMILNLYPDDQLFPEYLEAGKQRAVEMLERAATVEFTQQGNHVNVRVVNETGHKLPTGYPEGRRMWINVQLSDDEGGLVREFGRYEMLTASLHTDDTKVYQAKLGLDASVAAMTGLPPGESFHFILNNVVVSDNRIPPRGFTNEAFQSVQAAPVGASYADEQHWDDTRFRLQASATTATVRLFYQSASKEFITFLRDENTTNDAGDILYEQWELTGKSPPVLMATAFINIDSFATGDSNSDGTVDLADYTAFVDCEGENVPVNCQPFDFDADTDVDLIDFGEFQIDFGR